MNITGSFKIYNWNTWAVTGSFYQDGILGDNVHDPFASGEGNIERKLSFDASKGWTGEINLQIIYNWYFNYYIT